MKALINMTCELKITSGSKKNCVKIPWWSDIPLKSYQRKTVLRGLEIHSRVTMLIMQKHIDRGRSTLIYILPISLNVTNGFILLNTLPIHCDNEEMLNLTYVRQLYCNVLFLVHSKSHILFSCRIYRYI